MLISNVKDKITSKHINIVLEYLRLTPTFSYFELSGKCMDSLYCGNSNFCNFDFHSTGYCETCLSLEGGLCENLGLITKKGEEECKRICEGN